MLHNCNTCHQNRPSKSRGPLQPIVILRKFQRWQFDLIDMTSRPDNGLKYIFNSIEMFTKYDAAFGIRDKTAESVATCLRHLVMMFGVPEEWHSDNGSEFQGEVDVLAAQLNIQHIRGRARHPQSQGAVEKANHTLKVKLSAACIDEGTTHWSILLPKVVIAMNSQRHTTIGMSPFKAMFGQEMNSLVAPGITVLSNSNITTQNGNPDNNHGNDDVMGSDSEMIDDDVRPPPLENIPAPQRHVNAPQARARTSSQSPTRQQLADSKASYSFNDDPYEDYDYYTDATENEVFDSGEESMVTEEEPIEVCYSSHFFRFI